MQMFRSHGITRAADRLQPSADGLDGGPSDGIGPAAWYYEQQLLGYNYRMTDIHATLGLSQLERLDEYVARRNDIARRYDEALVGLPLQLPTVQPGNLSAFHLYVVRVQAAATRKTHRQVFDELRARGIGVNLHYMPVHLQPYYRQLGFRRGQFPEAEAYGGSAISLPMFPGLHENAQACVIDAIRQSLADE
jgi:dTDP-4-amino-4,6-dideoxygalactose transaminase